MVTGRPKRVERELNGVQHGNLLPSGDPTVCSSATNHKNSSLLPINNIKRHSKFLVPNEQRVAIWQSSRNFMAGLLRSFLSEIQQIHLVRTLAGFQSLFVKSIALTDYF